MHKEGLRDSVLFNILPSYWVPFWTFDFSLHNLFYCWRILERDLRGREWIPNFVPSRKLYIPCASWVSKSTTIQATMNISNFSHFHRLDVLPSSTHHFGFIPYYQSWKILSSINCPEYTLVSIFFTYYMDIKIGFILFWGFDWNCSRGVNCWWGGKL